jgi:hypothetical protein
LSSRSLSFYSRKLEEKVVAPATGAREGSTRRLLRLLAPDERNFMVLFDVGCEILHFFDDASLETAVFDKHQRLSTFSKLRDDEVHLIERTVDDVFEGFDEDSARPATMFS